MNREQGLDEILSLAHTSCWDPHGQAIIAKAVQAGFDPGEVEDELRSPWSSRYDSRSGAAWPPNGTGRPPVAGPTGTGSATRSLQRTDTEEELKRIRNRQELYEARKQLHEQEVQDAARNHTEVTEHTMALEASVRFPKAPVAPPNVLMAVQSHLPLAALRQALPASTR